MDFYFVLFVVVAVAVLYVAFQVVGKPAARSTRHEGKQVSNATRLFFENSDWLRERWKLAAADDAAGRTDMFPRWYFDEPSERQLDRLERENARPEGNVTKGQVSDMIGLFEPPEDDKLEVLRYFKVATSGMNQTRARHESAMLLRDAENAKAWEQRPPDADQRECLKYFGLPVTKSTTHAVAAKVIATLLVELSARNDPRVDEWHYCQSLLEQFDDAESLREELEIKRPSAALLRQAIGELQKEGVSFEKMDGDPELVRDRLLKIKPELARPFDE